MKWFGVFFVLLFCYEAYAQCVAGGSNRKDGLEGSKTLVHVFQNQCLAEPGTSVRIIIDAMADLGCDFWDATHLGVIGSECPEECDPPCCDVAPSNKYLTVKLNFNLLTHSIPGSSNIPENGLFFAAWANNCLAYTVECSQAGRSVCDPNVVPANRHIIFISAETWNEWLGGNGNAMSVAIHGSDGIFKAPLDDRSLALYCENLGFINCGYTCDGLCGALTYSNVNISYAPIVTCIPSECPQGGECQYGDCLDGICILLNKAYGTACGDQSDTDCDNPDTCNNNGVCIGNKEPFGVPCLSDHIYCTIDECDAKANCLHTPNNHLCDDYNVCTSELCDIEQSGCIYITNSNQCDDGLFCTANERCDFGQCVGYDSPCIENVCTYWSCSEELGCEYFENLYGDVDRNGVVNLFDICCITKYMNGIFDCSFEDCDIEPCGGNGVINVFDVFAVLDVIAGTDPCCVP